jgi:hypothetical protein
MVRFELKIPNHYKSIACTKIAMCKVSAAEARFRIFRFHKNSQKMDKNGLFQINERQTSMNLVQYERILHILLRFVNIGQLLRSISVTRAFNRPTFFGPPFIHLKKAVLVIFRDLKI